MVHTDKDVKIGGYTPIKWQSSGSYPPDKKKLSFIFSLTEGEKLQIKDGTQALQEKQGLAFGTFDLFICDKANINKCGSYANVDCSYTNEKYAYCGK